MPVFKLCLKIFKKNIPVMMIYFGLFIAVSIMMITMSTPTDQTGFSVSKARVAFFSEENTPLVEGLKTSLAENADFIDIEDDQEILQDSLYYRKINYVLRIPQNFTADFMTGADPKVIKTSIPGSTSNVYVDLKIESYLNTARMYLDLIPGISQEKIKSQVLSDMAEETEVEMLRRDSSGSETGLMQYFFNYLAYTFMFIIIMGVSVIMLVFNDPIIKQRNSCSPFSTTKINLQIFLSILLFTFFSWIVLAGLSLTFAIDEIPNFNTKYYVLNSLIFALTSSALSYLIASLVKGREAMIAIANVVTLGSSFISGVFIPQDLLSEGVLKIASFLPTYWFVRGNRMISMLMEKSGPVFDEMVSSMLIQLGFAFGFFILTMIVSKKKRSV
ncbi:ABC transporter permease [Alkalibacter mobilis]|uniref:ABC transporter permease n=1 Tax=Alkalibacter mobilis TaxID=2787712 RepID=UPI0018A06014|nr:ABC transporter permease [Alkalibacter mobilis]MBF7097496.1 ABC transporter permease [Alkalibacter mobilis]